MLDHDESRDIFYVDGVPVHTTGRTDTAAFVVPVATPHAAARIVSLRDLRIKP